jgi:hypothetical protein
LGVGERLTNSERRLQQLADDSARDEPRGILEIFEQVEDEDSALARDPERERDE